MTEDRAVARPAVAAPARVERAAVAEGCPADVLRAGVADCPVVRAGVWRVAAGDRADAPTSTLESV